MENSANIPHTMNEYREMLREANILSSKGKHKDELSILLRCIEGIETSGELGGKRKYDLLTLFQRVSYLRKRYGFDVEYDPDEKYQAIMREYLAEKGKLGLDYSAVAEAESVKRDAGVVSGGVSVAVSSAESSTVEPDEIAETPLISEVIEIPSIINQVFDKLLMHDDVSYDEYLELYAAINSLANDNAEIKPFIKTTAVMAYFVGDTHGSYDESIIMINYFIKVIEKHPDVKIIFIGDYVDRNPYDLENLSLIAAFRYLYPNNVFLLRGNHEDRIINSRYGFIQNLLDNFIIPDRVEKLYERILTYFTTLPIAMTVKLESSSDTYDPINIFVVHGGIPVYEDNPEKPVILEDIEDRINIRAKDYGEFDPFMNWMLWADPKEELRGILNDPSTGRSQFGPDIFDLFLKANNLNYMVRAHERWEKGYKFFFNERLVSLFSTSYYRNRKVGEGAFLRLIHGRSPTILYIHENLLERDLSYL